MRHISTTLLLLSLFLVFSARVQAQQDPLYSQYMFNPAVLNPAYAGLYDMASATATHRQQWIGMGEGHPASTTLNAHSSLPVDKMGVGVTFLNDQYAITSRNEFNLAYSYKLTMGEKKLSFGLQGGFSALRMDYGRLNPKDADDVNFSTAENITDSKPNFGFGAMYATPLYFVSLSVPKLLGHDVDDGTETTTNRYRSHIYLHTGYIFDLANEIKIKPSVLVKYVNGSPVNIDINGSILLEESLWLGLSFRNSSADLIPNSLVIMSQLQVTDLIKVGYSYDFIFNNDLRRAAGWFSTHEFMVNVNFPLFDQQAVQTVYY